MTATTFIANPFFNLDEQFEPISMVHSELLHWKLTKDLISYLSIFSDYFKNGRASFGLCFMNRGEVNY